MTSLVPSSLGGKSSRKLTLNGPDFESGKCCPVSGSPVPRAGFDSAVDRTFPGPGAKALPSSSPRRERVRWPPRVVSTVPPERSLL